MGCFRKAGSRRGGFSVSDGLGLFGGGGYSEAALGVFLQFLIAVLFWVFRQICVEPFGARGLN